MVSHATLHVHLVEDIEMIEHVVNRTRCTVELKMLCDFCYPSVSSTMGWRWGGGKCLKDLPLRRDYGM